jgi:tetratricopeptide (TPR) repeat protein
MVTEEEIRKKYPIPEDFKSPYDEAISAMERGEYDDARFLLERLLLECPEHPRILNALGETLRRKRDYETAENYYFRAITTAPDYAYAYNNLSLMYSCMGDADKAAEYARLSMQIMNSSPIPWHTLGIYYMARKQLRVALDYLLAAYSYDPNYTKAAYNAACCYALLGETDRAFEFLEKSLDSPERIAKAEQDDDLAEIREHPGFKQVIEKAKKFLRVE